jgi:hypothetical protein
MRLGFSGLRIRVRQSDTVFSRDPEIKAEAAWNGPLLRPATQLVKREGGLRLREQSTEFQPMLAKRIIPCLDVTGGRVVKGVNFTELRDAGDPVEIAARYNEQGADELTFLDITATSDGRDLILHIIEAVASQVFIPLTVGGGVRTVEDVRRLLNAGADKTSFNSAAIANPHVIARRVRQVRRRSASWWRSTPSAAAPTERRR